MTKQELIEALKAKRRLVYEDFFKASKRWEKYRGEYGTEDILTRLEAEKMEANNARIEEINAFLHDLESLED